MIHGGRGRGEEWKGLSSLAVLLFSFCILVLPTLFSKPTKKTDVYFLLHGAELTCLLRKCQLTSILKVVIWHWILGAGGEEKETRGT